MRAKLSFSLGVLGLAVAAAACASSTPSSEDDRASLADAGTSTGSVVATSTEDYVATSADFVCLSSFAQVRKMRITNPTSDAAKTEAIAIATRSGTDYPVGTIVQIIPQHAMAKRRAGFNPRGNDWEFFVLDVSDAGTTIAQRGGNEVTAPQIGSCQQCHDRAKAYDFLCEENHGCKSNGHTPAELMEMQADDPRCSAN